ncbi:hypothetical protein VSU19_10215 [Verrucomicrobiales bacterium BCK34]|nr:hypothetical protein [Verrucomicrobiales bacterium BCK34]
MPLSLPNNPTGEQFEDLVVSALTVLGYFVESNMTLSHDGKEILELDVVATPVGEGAPARILFEVKKDRFNFTNTFKLYGQKQYLGIGEACLVSMRGANEDHLPVYQSKGKELGVRMCSFPLDGINLTSLGEQKNGLTEQQQARLVAPLWYQNICRRIALSELRRRCKENQKEEAFRKARSYLFTTRASFFQREPLARAETLYQAYFDHPKLSGSIVTHRAKSKKNSEDELWKKARDSHQLLDVQCVMDLESVARFVIVKNALDDAFERGDDPRPSYALKFGEISLDIPRHNLPPKYFDGLKMLKEHEHGPKIPYLFEAFYTVLGGYLFVEMEDELDLLSKLTNIPSGMVVECLRFMEVFFGNFFMENKYKMLLMKGVPAIVRGGGSLARQRLFEIEEYKDRYGEAHWLLGMWHNAIYKALEPHLEQKE